MRRRDDGRYECALCGAVLDVPRDTLPTVVVVGRSGKPNVRILMVGSSELHRCEPPQPETMERA